MTEKTLEFVEKTMAEIKAKEESGEIEVGYWLDYYSIITDGLMNLYEKTSFEEEMEVEIEAYHELEDRLACYDIPKYYNMPRKLFYELRSWWEEGETFSKKKCDIVIALCKKHSGEEAFDDALPVFEKVLASHEEYFKENGEYFDEGDDF